MPAARKKTSRPPVPDGEALVLTGTPRRLSTTVTVHNATDDAVTVRSAALRTPDGAVSTAQVAARLPAGATGELPVTVAVDPRTAPGEYPAELDVAGTARPAVLRVDPDVDLAVSPHTVVASVGEQPLRVRIANRGNVPVTVAARLRSRLWSDGVVTDLDVGADLDATITVEPGTAVDATGRLLVPDVDPTRRYRGCLPIGTADLVVLVLPRDAEPKSRPPRTASTPARRKEKP